jgi:hypothetical protein
VALMPEDPEVNGSQLTPKFSFTSPSSEPRSVRTAEGRDRTGGARDPERDEVVRQGGDGEARRPDVVVGCCLPPATARRRPCPRRGILVRRRVPQSQQERCLGG